MEDGAARSKGCQRKGVNVAGTIYLVATPIGNLEDMTFRAIKVLNQVDKIACEDTRNSIKLLNHFDIKKPLTSYHEYNKYDKARELIDFVLQGHDIAVITDAGMPGISDPGEELVRMAYEHHVRVCVIPGASAVVSALAISGLRTGRFLFEAFLPSDKKKRERILESLKNETRTIILYEAPHRLRKTLADLLRYMEGSRKISLVRELTKRYEEVIRTSLEEAVSFYSKEENTARGEFVLLLEGKDEKELAKEARDSWEEIGIPEHMQMYEEKGYSPKEAMKLVAKDRGVPKREIYQTLLEK